MRKLLSGIAGIGFLTLVLPGLLYSVPENIKLVNTTGYTLQQVFIAPISWGDWGEDLLSGEFVEDGTDKTFKLAPFADSPCSFDIRAVDTDGDEYIQYDRNLCEKAEIVLTFDDYVENEEYDGDSGLFDEGYNAGYEEGLKAGKQEGFKEGYGQGFKDGFKEGSGRVR